MVKLKQNYKFLGILNLKLFLICVKGLIKININRNLFVFWYDKWRPTKVPMIILLFKTPIIMRYTRCVNVKQKFSHRKL